MEKGIRCDNMAIRILAIIGRHSIGQILYSKYSVPSIIIDTIEIKHRLWKHFWSCLVVMEKLYYSNVCESYLLVRNL